MNAVRDACADGVRMLARWASAVEVDAIPPAVLHKAACIWRTI